MGESLKVNANGGVVRRFLVRVVVLGLVATGLLSCGGNRVHESRKIDLLKTMSSIEFMMSDRQRIAPPGNYLHCEEWLVKAILAEQSARIDLAVVTEEAASAEPKLAALGREIGVKSIMLAESSDVCIGPPSKLWEYNKLEAMINQINGLADPELKKRAGGAISTLKRIEVRCYNWSIGERRREIAKGWTETMRNRVGHERFLAFATDNQWDTLEVSDALMTPGIAQALVRSEGSYWLGEGFKKVVFLDLKGRRVAVHKLGRA